MRRENRIFRSLMIASLVLTVPMLAISAPTSVHAVAAPPSSPMAFATGGPDGFGYRFMDSQESNGPVYASEYVDISSSGTAVTFGDYNPVSVWGATNEGHQEVQIGFPFTFYGNSYTSVWVNTNFFLKFGGPTYVTNTGAQEAWVIASLPTTQQPNIIAVNWQDPAVSSARYAMLGTAPNRVFIVYWSTTGETREVKLYEDGRIVMLFPTVTSTNYGTTGIQNSTGTVGLQYGFNGTPNAVANNRAIQFFVPTSSAPNPPTNAGHAGSLPESNQQATANPDERSGWTNSQISFSATVTDPDATQTVRLRVRVKPTTSSTWTLLDSGLQPQGLISIPYTIPDDGSYDWEYRAEDTFGDSYPDAPVTDSAGWVPAFSNTNTPDFRSDQTPASAPQALTPDADLSSIFAGADLVTFTWGPSVDNGPASALRYDVQVSRNSLFTDLEATATNLTATSSTLSVTVARTEKHWRVRSTDVSGNVSEWSNVGRFRLVFDDQVDHAAGDAEKNCGFSAPGSINTPVGLLLIAVTTLALGIRRRR